MEQKSAETTVKVLAIVEWVLAAFSLLAGLMMLAGGSLFAGIFGAASNLFTGLFVVMAIIMLIFAVLYVFVGIGLWKHKNWARITAIVLGVLMLLSFPIGTIIGAAMIYFLAFDSGVKGLF